MAVQLTPPLRTKAPRFTAAEFLPHRGMMLSRLTALLSDNGGEMVELTSQVSPPGTDDAFGNASFSFGGAFLIPFANRVRGTPSTEGMITLDVRGQPVELPANWSGGPGAEAYAMHGLILDQLVGVQNATADRVEARLAAGAFSPPWPGDFDLEFSIRLDDRSLHVVVLAQNTGDQPAPIGIGWHPYFLLPSGDRSQARLHIPAARRLDVEDYVSVLPTGRVLDVAGSPYDFRAEEGVALADLSLDDCFVELKPTADIVARLSDPTSGLCLQIKAAAPARALQVYAPADKPFVVIEPQFNWSDPFGAIWKDRDTGMALVEPGGSVEYRVELELLDLSPQP